LGFCGLWFFLILAPTSSVVPLVTQTGAEHRIYLPLAGLVALVVLGGYGLWCRISPRLPRSLRALPVLLVLLVVGALGARTLVRNEDYRSGLSIWQSAVDRWPRNARAHSNLGIALSSEGREPEAVAQYEEALRLDPDFADAHNNLGKSLAAAGRQAEAMAQYEDALRLKPDFAEAYYNLGNAQLRSGRTEEAMALYEKALAIRPNFAQAHNNLGVALADQGRSSEAVAQLEEALRLRPDYAEARSNLKDVLSSANSESAAALAAKPGPLQSDAAERHNNRGIELTNAGRTQEAIDQFEQALRLRPDYAEARNNLGNVLAMTGRAPEAAAQYEEALRLKPDFAETYNSLAWLRATAPDPENRNASEALRLAQKAVSIKGKDPNCLDTLAAAYAEAGDYPQAVANAARALELARTGGNVALAQEIQARLERYRAREPFHQSLQ
jgi:tetratricopeptide (TPR) repeat protein